MKAFAGLFVFCCSFLWVQKKSPNFWNQKLFSRSLRIWQDLVTISWGRGRGVQYFSLCGLGFGVLKNKFFENPRDWDNVLEEKQWVWMMGCQTLTFFCLWGGERGYMCFGKGRWCFPLASQLYQWHLADFVRVQEMEKTVMTVFSAFWEFFQMPQSDCKSVGKLK